MAKKYDRNFSETVNALEALSHLYQEGVFKKGRVEEMVRSLMAEMTDEQLDAYLEYQKERERPSTTSLVFPIVSDSLPSLLDRAINILFLSFHISFVRKVARGDRGPNFAFCDAVSKRVHGVREIGPRVVAGVARLRSEVLDALEITTVQARAPKRDGRGRLGLLRFI